FNDAQELFSALRHAFKTQEHIEFRSTYQTPADPLIANKERVQMTILEIWKMYKFCVDHNLPEVWAYLWENWYRRGRWELWARAEHPQIPRLKTTMMVESHWRCIKKDFLHHFHKPRIDLLVWILVVKLAPRYYRRLEIMMGDIGRYRDLPSWRKDFKCEWRRCKETQITLPLNVKYRPDPHRWVCTCPYYVKSRFLICKHLVQAVHPVHPRFFLEVTRNRTTPFWVHPTLRPLDSTPTQASSASASSIPLVSTPSRVEQDPDPADDSDEELVELRAGRATFDERLTSHLSKIRDFCDAMEYQRQFRDTRMLDVFEREGAGFLRLIDQCMSRERRDSSTRSIPSTTWDRSTASAMFYRTRPTLSERDT
ncbi:hypothetical protein C8R43DRAFT_875882, partial [Mycena crocata]